MESKTRGLGLIFVGALIALASYQAGASSQTQEDDQGQLRSGQYEFINPLLECNDSDGINARKVNFGGAVENKVREVKKAGNLTNVALYYRDLNNGPVFWVNKDQGFVPGSLGKLPLAMALYKMSEEDPSILTRRVKYEKPRIVRPNAASLDAVTVLKVGESYELSELIDLMLRYSDNQAASLIYDNIELKYVDDIFLLLGLDGDILRSNNLGQLGVRQYSAFLRILYNSSYLTEKNSNTILSSLSKSDFTLGLRAGLPSEVKVANKFGFSKSLDGHSQVHDCGIIYYPKRPYLLCILTEGDNQASLEKAISEISVFVYSEVDKYNKKYPVNVD